MNSWRDAIVEIGSSIEQRNFYKQASRSYAMSHRLLETGVGRWVDAIEKVMGTQVLFSVS